MKIAFFNYLPMSAGGGLAHFYRETVAELSKRFPSADPQIVSFDESTAHLIQGAYSVYFLRNERMSIPESARHPTVHTLYGLGKLLGGFDLVYTKNDILDLTLLSLATIGTKIPPVVIGFHTPIRYTKTPTAQSKAHNALYASRYYRSLLAQAKGFHALNAFHESQLIQWFPKTPVKIIHNFVDSTILKPRSGKINGALKILWIGRLTRDKGCDDLIKLVREGRRRRVKWTVIGDGAMRKQIEHLQRDFDNLTYVPAMEHNMLVRQYRAHDVYLSTSNWECLPYTVMEANMCGLPVIGYDIPGNTDIVSRETGILVSTVEDLGKKIDGFKRNSFSKKKIRESTIKRFDKNNSVAQLYSFFKTFRDKSLR